MVRVWMMWLWVDGSGFLLMQGWRVGGRERRVGGLGWWVGFLMVGVGVWMMWLWVGGFGFLLTKGWRVGGLGWSVGG